MKEKKAEAPVSFLDDDDLPPLEEIKPTTPSGDEEDDDDFPLPKKPTPPDGLGNVKPKARHRTNVDPELPQITVIERDGLTARKKRAVDMGLSERILPPMTKGRTAVYKWIEKINLDPLTGEAPEPKDITLPGTYMLHDMFEMDFTNKQKLMRNLGRPLYSRDEKGKEVISDTIEAIEFTAGMLRILPEQNYRKYVFMELHPLNKSNPYRPKGEGAPLFERIDIKYNKSEAYMAAEQDLAYEAEKSVVNIVDRDEIIGYAVSTGVIMTSGKRTDQIKTDLRMWARANPRKFFAMHNNVHVPVRLNLIDAVTLGILQYEPDKRRFVDPESNKQIFVTTIGKDPMDDFVDAMTKKENQEIYQYIVGLLNYWE